MGDDACVPQAVQLQLPADANLPLFVYGNLKPSELGYELIESNVAQVVPARIAGYLWVTDGVPLAEMSGHGSISGWVLHFISPSAYDAVCRFEPAKFYQWTTTTSADPPGIQVNVLVPSDGLRPAHDGGDVLHAPWSTTDDPLFKFGLGIVRRALLADGQDPIHLVGDDPAEWARFYRLQAAYMLTCSILERTAFRVVAEPGTTSAVNKLGRRDGFVAAVDAVGPQNYGRKVTASDNPGRGVNLNQPQQFAQWAYQIRNNLMHRGKSASKEAELVRTALADLHDVLRTYLLGKVPALGVAWGQIEPDGEPHEWRFKQQAS